MPDTYQRVIDLAKRYWFEAGCETSICFTSQSAGRSWLYERQEHMAKLEEFAVMVKDNGCRDFLSIEWENEQDNPAWNIPHQDIVAANQQALNIVKRHGLKFTPMAVLQGPMEGLFAALNPGMDAANQPAYGNIHIYGRSLGGFPYPGWNFGTVEDAVTEIESLLWGAERNGVQLWIPTRITETGVYTRMAGGSFSQVRQRGYWQAAKAFQHPAIDAICLFTLWDWAVPQEELDEGKDWGGVDVAGSTKSSYRALFPGVDINEHAEPWGGAPVYEFVLGFLDWYNAAPGLIGEPTENEHNFNPGVGGWQMQRTSNGMLQWVEGKGKSFLAFDGRLYVWPEGADWYQEV